MKYSDGSAKKYTNKSSRDTVEHPHTSSTAHIEVHVHVCDKLSGDISLNDITVPTTLVRMLFGTAIPTSLFNHQ